MLRFDLTLSKGEIETFIPDYCISLLEAFMFSRLLTRWLPTSNIEASRTKGDYHTPFDQVRRAGLNIDGAKPHLEGVYELCWIPLH